ncbi:phosphatidylcholine/phosphatidylserine synthase [Jatrophihabitans endophyticus]|uniref:CDP-alcohol phosphatidyltransferase family protein n=1 Tax=Jatrophihabitans endophyticus TaxID=1206085 RepID=UPI0019ED1B5E|nr:CDP-alcohol phosphatidyltransferase family protein [Jatrophihabitans endophyticus]MBE7186891.1 hypothetical protein [Jatrophihabitans endophyticus]
MSDPQQLEQPAVSSPFRRDEQTYTSAEWGGAWLVHVFTTLGIVAAMLALRDVLVGRPDYAIIWLLLTLLIDGVDGPIARALEVEKRVPGLDGFLLDLIIDYVTCVIVPACFMYQFRVVPQNNYGIAVLCLLVFTGAIWFARKDMMTSDNWFRGQPAAWNIIGPVMFLLGTREGVGAVVTIVLSLLSLTNVPFPHIARARWMQPLTVAAGVALFGGMALGAFGYPHRYTYVHVLLLVGGLYFFVLAAARMLATSTPKVPAGPDPRLE